MALHRSPPAMAWEDPKRVSDTSFKEDTVGSSVLCICVGLYDWQ